VGRIQPIDWIWGVRCGIDPIVGFEHGLRYRTKLRHEVDYRLPTLSCTRMTSRLIDLEVPVEKAFLVAVDTGAEDGWTAQESLSELANLATTAGADVVGAEWQNRRHVDPNWYIG
jgi:hypothetical protein